LNGAIREQNKQEVKAIPTPDKENNNLIITSTTKKIFVGGSLGIFKNYMELNLIKIICVIAELVFRPFGALDDCAGFLFTRAFSPGWYIARFQRYKSTNGNNHN
jgi:hypothetical protein